jgi:hypothetical protein
VIKRPILALMLLYWFMIIFVLYKIEIMKLTLLEMYELYRNGLLTKKILNDYEK